MRQNQININGKKVSYYETRDNGQVVVFVHGTSSCSSIFVRQLIDSVLSYQFRFIAVDLIGFGNSEASDKPDTDYTIQGMSNFLIDFCKEMKIKDAVFVGHDIGGNIILESYDKLANPKGVALLGSAPFSKPINKDMFLETPVIELFSKSGIDSSEVHQIARSFVEENTQYPDFIPEIIRKADRKTRDYFFQSVDKGDFKNQINTLKEIKEPVAIYYGEYDQIINYDYYKIVNIPALWKGIIHVIKDVGHIFFYESPADFNISFEIFLNTAFSK